MTKVGKVGRVLSFATLLTAFCQFPACELTVDTAPLSNGACPGDKKACFVSEANKMECVSNTDPDHGCKGNCGDCKSQLIKPGLTDSHVDTAACLGQFGTCSVSTCISPWDHCDNSPYCDTDLSKGTVVDENTLVKNCNRCGLECRAPTSPPPNGKPICQLRACKWACNIGFQDCDGVFGNGCECNTNVNQCVSGHCIWKADGGPPQQPSPE